MNHTPTVAVIGMATIDYLYLLPQHPGADTENQALEHLAVVGGPAGRGAIAAARLGAQVRLLATCGSDFHAQQLRAHVEAEGIEATWTVTEGVSQHSAILVATDAATRTTIWLPQPRADRRMIGELDSFLDGADIALLDTTDEQLTRAAVAACRRAGVPTVLDTGSWKDWVRDVLHEFDYPIAPAKYFGSDDDLGEAMLSLYSSQGLSFLGATRGSLGGRYLLDGVAHLWNAADVDAVDTCGAGDTFHGAFAFAIAAGYEVARALDIAAWAAALKVKALGNGSIPTWEELAAANPSLELQPDA